MKMILEFDDNENDFFMEHYNGPSYKVVLERIDNELRRQAKHTDQSVIKIDHLRGLIRSEVDDLGLPPI